MEITADIEIKQSPLLKPIFYCLYRMAAIGIIKPETAGKWATAAANRAFKFRVDKGDWQKVRGDMEIEFSIVDDE